MSKWIGILSGLLVAQLVLALSLNLSGQDYGAFEPEEPLLAFDTAAVNGLRIEDGEHSVLLTRQDGEWVLPEDGGFPADQPLVERLLDQLAALEKGWPVATSAGAAKRFQVVEGAFERRLTLLAGDEPEPQATLYVGTSPGFRKVHVRPADEDAVYAVAFNTWEANATADDWIDKDILKLDVAEVERVELPAVALERNGEALEVVGLSDAEQTNAQEASALLGRVAGMRVQSVLGREAKPEYRQAEPALEVAVQRKGGETLTYRFSQPEDASHYVVKRSDLEHYFQVPAFTVEPIAETGREQLVVAAAVPAAGEADAGETAAGQAAVGEEPPAATQAAQPPAPDRAGTSAEPAAAGGTPAASAGSLDTTAAAAPPETTE